MDKQLLKNQADQKQEQKNQKKGAALIYALQKNMHKTMQKDISQSKDILTDEKNKSDQLSKTLQDQLEIVKKAREDIETLQQLKANLEIQL